MKPTGRFRLEAEGPYSLSASIRFFEGFAPASYGGEDADRLRMAFVADGLDGGERVAGVLVRSDGGSGVTVDTYGEAAPEAVRGQLERILSLDADGRGFPGVGERDPVVGGLQGRYPGLRPVLFWSPYEAAAWAIVGNRIRIAQAAKVKARMGQELGEEVEVAGARERAFPGPSRLATLEGFPGLLGRKAEWLRALARAAEEGKLEASRLRSMPAEQALADLKELPGIGDFGAELILVRGASVVDRLPTHEPRLARAVAMAYGLEEPPDPVPARSNTPNSSHRPTRRSRHLTRMST